MIAAQMLMLIPSGPLAQNPLWCLVLFFIIFWSVHLKSKRIFCVPGAAWKCFVCHQPWPGPRKFLFLNLFFRACRRHTGLRKHAFEAGIFGAAGAEGAAKDLKVNSFNKNVPSNKNLQK
jgi:hypothetical protein